MIDLPYSVAGFVVGAIVGLTGVGGGSLMTPLLVLGFGVAPVTAVGTDLLFAGFTKVGGAVSHGLKQQVDWRVTGWLATGSVPGALLATVRIVGTDIAHAVPITLLAGLGHAALGNVNWALLASLLVGSLPGILLGSHLAPRIPERALRHSLAAVLLLAGGKLVLA